MEPKPAHISVDEYMRTERRAKTKNELIGGAVYAMAEASPRHNAIVTNLVGELRAALRERPCVVLSSDQRVWVEETDLFTYPDVVVACEPLLFHPKFKDTLANPRVIVEVLSSSTEAYDRGAKFGHYRRIASLREYVLVSQNAHRIEHHLRLESGQWVLTEYQDGTAVEFPTLELRIPSTEVYAKTDTLEGEAELRRPT